MQADLKHAFAPTGVLRASINLGNPILANRHPTTGQPVGVSIDLATALAQRLEVPLELVVFDTAAQSVDAIGQNAADIGFFAIDPNQRRTFERSGVVWQFLETFVQIGNLVKPKLWIVFCSWLG